MTHIIVKTYPITPMGAPRMTRADAWKKRPVVLKYRAFKDEIRLHKLTLENGDGIEFFIPMPKSWSQKKKDLMYKKPCASKPDLDNMLKALMDALFQDDAHIWHISDMKKVWSYTGAIKIYRSLKQ